MPDAQPYKIVPPYYPIVYVRGYAMTAGERDDVFHDAYYGFSATSVEKRDAAPPKYFEVDIFEGQFIRLMKMKMYGYADAVNRGLHDFHDNPTRSIFISRFYDRDYLGGTIRSITQHAEELCDLIVGGPGIIDDVRSRLRAAAQNRGTTCDFGKNDREFKVILIAHSMGGLVCRTLMQNIMTERKLDPKAWIHRLVTIGSPHGGIELGHVPDILEKTIERTLNPFDSRIFDPDNIRNYLNLTDEHDANSLGDVYPVKRCFCIIGSDYHSYNATKYVTGGFSDGLVKQDRAYVVQGKKPAAGKRYGQEDVAFGANVHRAHSGNRGIVNSYESYENLTRFLFGNLRADISLSGVEIQVPKDPKARFFYDFEFLASIKGTGVYLQRREQDPCENAIRFESASIPDDIFLYTGFLRSSEKLDAESKVSEFALTVRVVEHRIEKGLLWDHEYPGRQIYNETLIIGVGDLDEEHPGDKVQTMWLSDRGDFKRIEPDKNGVYTIPLRPAASVPKGSIRIAAAPWNNIDNPLTKDNE